MLRTLEVFEHQRIAVGAGDDNIRAIEFDELVKFNDQHRGQYFEVGHKQLKTRNFVGFVQIGDLAIEILPKADKHNTSSPKVWKDGLLEMLRVAFGLRLQSLPSSQQKLSRSRLLDLIAQAYLEELEVLLREGLAKGYRTTTSNGVVFRGRLKMSEHLRENVARADRFFVEYQTFDHDVLVNQLLVAALETLSWCALAPGIACRVDATSSRFPAVQHRATTTASFDRVRLSRSTQRYSNALTYARMILAQQGPQLRDGRERVFALLFDMNVLWERYIAVLFQRASRPTLNVSAQEQHRFWESSGSTKRVKPDIVVRSESGTTVLVIDTKWKVPSKGLPSDEDLKQMFIYNELLDCQRSMLLYPSASTWQPVNGSYSKKTHGCEQRQVGLFDGAKWSNDAIKAQLRAIAISLA